MTWDQLADLIAAMTDTERLLPVVAARNCPEGFENPLRVLRIESIPTFYAPTLILED